MKTAANHSLFDFLHPLEIGGPKAASHLAATGPKRPAPPWALLLYERFSKRTKNYDRANVDAPLDRHPFVAIRASYGWGRALRQKMTWGMRVEPVSYSARSSHPQGFELAGGWARFLCR